MPSSSDAQPRQRLRLTPRASRPSQALRARQPLPRSRRRYCERGPAWGRPMQREPSSDALINRVGAPKPRARGRERSPGKSRTSSEPEQRQGVESGSEPLSDDDAGFAAGPDRRAYSAAEDHRQRRGASGGAIRPTCRTRRAWPSRRWQRACWRVRASTAEDERLDVEVAGQRSARSRESRRTFRARSSRWRKTEPACQRPSGGRERTPAPSVTDRR